MQFSMIIDDKIKVSMKEKSFKKLKFNFLFFLIKLINYYYYKNSKYANNLVSKIIH